MIIYNTKDGDVLDDICYHFYGHLDGTVEKVLEANDFLGFQPPVLPAGLKIQLPEINDKKSTQTVRLW
jgi:phage tail protein X